MQETKLPAARAYVHLLPSLIPEGSLTGGVAIVVDVLRATTAMVHALASGCDAVVPCLEVDEARHVASRYPAGSVILGGERQGLPIEGFTLGNSPNSYTEAMCRQKTLVMTTTNGTRAILACLRRLPESSSRPASRTSPPIAAVLRADANRIHVVCLRGRTGAISLRGCDARRRRSIEGGALRTPKVGTRPMIRDHRLTVCTSDWPAEAEDPGTNDLAGILAVRRRRPPRP